MSKNRNRNNYGSSDGGELGIDNGLDENAGATDQDRTASRLNGSRRRPQQGAVTRMVSNLDMGRLRQVNPLALVAGGAALGVVALAVLGRRGIFGTLVSTLGTAAITALPAMLAGKKVAELEDRGNSRRERYNDDDAPNANA